MHHLSPETTTVSSNIHNDEDQILSIGSANTLKRAMTVNKLTGMLDCIKDMKFYAKTIEKDLPDYLHSINIDRTTETNSIEFETDDFIQLAQQRSNDNRYILLNDLIEQGKVYLFYLMLTLDKYSICIEIK